MNTIYDIAEAWPTLAEFAHDAGVTVGAARMWCKRNSIPGAYWLALVNGAQHRGIEGVTLMRLGRIAAASLVSRASQSTRSQQAGL